MEKTGKSVAENWPLAKKADLVYRFWKEIYGSLMLVVLRDKGEVALGDFRVRLLNTHQAGHFLEGVKRLGIDLKEPPAVIAGKYHYFSNMLGGLEMEYVEESPKKTWIRYLAPNWVFGTGLAAVPATTQRRMLSGWHPLNGEALGCPRLVFVCTKVHQDGEPYDEGYFGEADSDVPPHRRIQYKAVSVSPDFDEAKAPKLDPRAWPDERKHKAKRAFPQGYVENSVRTLVGMYGVPAASFLISQACACAAIQTFKAFRQELHLDGREAQTIARFIRLIGDFAGDEGEMVEESKRVYLVRNNPRRFFREPDLPPRTFEALYSYFQMSAKILSARIEISMTRFRAAGDTYDEWMVRGTEKRLF